MKGGLDTLVLRLTNRCNLACGYCYAGSGPIQRMCPCGGRKRLV